MDALEDGAGFDGLSIEGFARIDESDMLAKIEWERYRVQITNYELEEHLPML